jgi:hypothetical protein
MIRKLWLLLTLAPAQAGAFEMAFPVQCTLNDTCFIQQYPDHDPGPAATDFTCGPLSYDGHNGTDIALPTLAAMASGVAVLAAAPGTVGGIRDGMRDGPPGADVKNRECGNGVLIDHADGWQTQYCHMRQGSIAVRQGETVSAGTPLGMIGQSGLAEFPHLHLSVRHNGEDVDPFAPNAATCGPAADDLWTDLPTYTAGGIINIGLASEVPEFDAIKAGLPPANLTAQSRALVVWAHVFGARAGDALLLDITGPDGAVITERLALDRTQARLFRAVGKHLRGTGWPTGAYTGTARILRDGAEIGVRQVIVQIGG